MATWAEWAEGVLLRASHSIPGHDRALHLIVTCAVITETFAGLGWQAWSEFLATRQVADA